VSAALPDRIEAERATAAASVIHAVLLLPLALPDSPPVLFCSKLFDHGSERAGAAELLLIADPDGGWAAKPRCKDHPAVDDVRLLRKVSPLSACMIVRIADAAEVLGEPSTREQIRADRIACGVCGSHDFALQLGGQNHGAITCQACRAVIDPATPKACEGCGAEVELAPVQDHEPGCARA
jgi:hypothetical protein